MKRIIPVLLACLLLCACLPTPEQEYVVSKNDNVLEQKLNATPLPEEDTVAAVTTDRPADRPAPSAAATDAPTSAPSGTQRFSDRWDEEAGSIRDHVTLSIHADVVTKADGLYPVYKTRQAPFTERRVIEIAETLLQKPEKCELIDGLTKEEWTKQFKEFLDEVAAWEEWVEKGKPDDGVDRDETGFDPAYVEEMSAWYAEQIQNAPDRLGAASASDYKSYQIGQSVNYTLASGEHATVESCVNQSWNTMSVSRNCKRFGYIYYEHLYEQDRKGEDPNTNARYWMEPTVTREEAEKTLTDAMNRLELSGFSVVYAEPATYLDAADGYNVAVSGGWAFVLRRDFDGYPQIDVSYEPSDLLAYGDGEAFVYNEPIKKEEITVFIDENGLERFSYIGQKEITGKANANVELLPFDRIQSIVKNTLSVCYPMRFRNSDRDVALEVYRMVLTTYTLRVRDEQDQYEIPCWVVFFDGWNGLPEEARQNERTRRDMHQECIVINAIDGSVVHDKLGY